MEKVKYNSEMSKEQLKVYNRIKMRQYREEKKKMGWRLYSVFAPASVINEMKAVMKKYKADLTSGKI